MIKLHDYNDAPVFVAAAQVMTVEEYPVGQCMITLTNGSIVQVKESVETVQALISKEKPT